MVGTFSSFGRESGGYRSSSGKTAMRAMRAAYKGRKAALGNMKALRAQNPFWMAAQPAALQGGGARASELKRVDWGTSQNSGDNDGNNDTLTVNATGAVASLGGIAAGTGDWQRIGRETNARSIELTYEFKPIAVARSAPMDMARVLLVYDRQTNGTAPSVSDILQDYSENSGATTSVDSGLNMNNKDRFLVLYDRRIQLPAVTTQVAAPSITAAYPNSFGGNGECTQDGFGLQHKFIKLRGLTTHFKGTDGGTGSIATGSYHLVVVGGIAAGSECFEIPKWHARMRYTDK